jgi:hypothetical protein
VQKTVDAIAGRRVCTVRLTNYKRDGTPFLNEVALTARKCIACDHLSPACFC